MDQGNMAEAENRIVKSIHSDTSVRVEFINETQRPVDLFWIDFQGKLVRYKLGLKPSKNYHINTYETHPWIARDTRTGSSLLIKKDFIYYPKANDEDDEFQQIFISLPVFRLIDRCVDFLRSHGIRHQADNLSIPTLLVQDLKKNPFLPCQEYQP
ncbi:von Hippel-Lindau-like protein [Haliotis rubra]|uniref:von Hippel-Lindau-like protein n=1 Tax=Haliotis rubra TaxID=36100 RepID=UPI001EE5B681|nr:von Hippel-Lindau-like protein [Haliotis rubra]